MLVITLHGFGMTGEGDELCQEINTLAKQHGHVGLTPTYPTNNPHLAHVYLTHYTESKLEYHKMGAIFIGHSLGGFWARHLAKTFGASSLVLINPALHPWDSLQPYIGPNRNSCTGGAFELATNDVAAHYVYRGDDSDTAIARVKTLLVATKNSSTDVIELFSDVRNVDVDIIDGYDGIIPSIERNIFPKEEDESEI